MEFMRWPLRNQILMPLIVLTLITLLLMSALNAWIASRRILVQLEQRLSEAARTLENSNIPLNDTVLKQTRGLSGAEFLVVDQSKRVYQSNPGIEKPANAIAPRDASQLTLRRTVDTNDMTYFHAAVKLDRRRFGGGQCVLHIFYPEQSWLQARNEAIYPPLIVGGASLLLLIVVSAAIAGRVTSPVARLQNQVEQIAAGNYEPLPVPSRDDEIRELATSINQMAETLARYEEQVRRGERLRTLGQLGGAVAHQMRNAVTGCRMALDLHQRDCTLGEDNEDMEVAIRQLSLMEKYLRRFLATSHESDGERTCVDLVALATNVISLVRPSALHLGTALEFEAPPGSLMITADSDGIEQLLINLILNAIEAANCDDARVTLSITDNRDSIAIEVKDNGPGPPPDIRDSIFDPLVTGKSDGAGLGLAIVRDIAEQHGGKVSWSREQDATCFVVELPRGIAPDPTASEERHGTLVDR